MIEIAICDDEYWCREELRKYCEDYFEGTGLEYRILEYASAEALLAGSEADLLLLDIEMAGQDGIQLKERMQQERRETRILFVTSHGEAMAEAFGKSVFGFLQKPLECSRLQEKLSLVTEDIRRCRQYVMVEGNHEIRRIEQKKLLYVKACGKYTYLYLKGEEGYLFSERGIGEWKRKLDTRDFFQCHKSYLVNFLHVQSIREEILLADQIRIPLSRRMRRECKEQYRKYLLDQAR